MTEIVDARDVLDANARTSRPFRAKILGHFLRTGPNRWDSYRFVPATDEREIDVLPGLKIQVEDDGTAFRIRSHGKVWRAEWIDGGPECCTTPFSHARGWGFKAVIASKLRER